MPTELPQPILLVLPFIATPLAGWLNDDSLPEWLNDVIALVVVVILAITATWITAPISNDGTLNIAMIFTYCLLLMRQPLLASMQRWFTIHVPSPFALLGPVAARPATIAATTGPITPYISPAAMELPAMKSPAATTRRATPITGSSRVSQAVMIPPGSLHGMTMPSALPPGSAMTQTAPDDEDGGDLVPV